MLAPDQQKVYMGIDITEFALLDWQPANMIDGADKKGSQQPMTAK